MPIIHYNNDILLLASGWNAVIVLTNRISILFPGGQVRWFFMILVDWSHWTRRWHEMSGRERPKVMWYRDGERWRQRYAWRRRREWWRTEGWFYSRKWWRWEWRGGREGYRKRAVTTEFDCCLCYAILESVTASTEGEGERGEPTSRWAGPPAAGSAPSWAGWIQSHHCYYESGLLKLAGRDGDEEAKQKERKEAEERGGGGAQQAKTAVRRGEGEAEREGRNREKNLPI